MNERLKVLDFKYKVLLWTFFLFLTISFLMPISFDDWSNYLVGKSGLGNIIDNVIYMYNHWEGRVVSRFLINILTYDKFLFNIIFSLLITGVVYSINTIIGTVNNKYFYLLAPLGLLIIPASMFAQNYAWVNGAITFTFPSSLTIIYFTYLYRKTKLKFSIKEKIILSLVSIITPMFVENIGIAFTVLNLLIFGHKIIIGDTNKRFHFILFLFSAISLTLMLMSPGSIIRMSGESAFSSLSLLQKLSVNLSNFINYTFVQNIFIMMLMLIPINYVIAKKLKGFVYSRLIIVAFNLIPIFSIFCNWSSLSPVNLNLLISKYSGIFMVDNAYFSIYWLLFISLFIYSVFYILPKGEVREGCITLITIAFISTFTMMFTPVFENRVTVLYLFVMLLVSILLIKNINVDIIKPMPIIIVTILLIIYYISIIGVNFYLNKSRNDYIKEQLSYNEDIIYVKANPLRINWNYNPYSREQEKMFKEYYNIPSNKKIKVKYLGIFENIEEFILKSK